MTGCDAKKADMESNDQGMSNDIYIGCSGHIDNYSDVEVVAHHNDSYNSNQLSFPTITFEVIYKYHFWR